MRIRKIRIENFRAIRLLELDNLPDAIVVAGPNGCGKSSLFDAIRLLKSAYGQYNPNEYQCFFQEFQIDVQKLSQEAHRVFHDPSKPLNIKVEFELASSEREYLQQNAYDLFLNILWGQIQGVSQSPMLGALIINPFTRRAHSAAVEEHASKLFEAFQNALKAQRHVAELKMEPGGEPFAEESPVVELIFSL